MKSKVPDILEQLILAGDIRASRRGHVYRRLSGKWKRLKPFLDGNGYRVLKLRLSGIRRGYSVSNIIWRCLNGRIPADHDIDHRDKQRGNDKIWNLRPLPMAVNRGKRDFSAEELEAMSATDFFSALAERKSEEFV